MADFAWTDFEQRHNDLEKRRERATRFLAGPHEFPCCRMPGCDHPVSNRDAMCIACQVKVERENNATIS